MYRSAAKRLLLVPSMVRNTSPQTSRIRTIVINSPRSRFSTSAASQTFNQSPNHHQQHAQTQSQSQSETIIHSDPASSSAKEEAPRYDSQTSRGTRPRAEYQDEQVRVLNASLRHVIRKEAALVEFFMDDCLERLIDRIDSGEDLGNLIPSERIAKLVRIRLEMQAPYISKWPQALSIQAQPLNIPISFKQRVMLVDEIWRAAGDEATDVDRYAKCTALGAIYTATEMYMLTDSSPDFRDTWVFLDGRVKDAFDLKKTFQEATYLAEAVGAGMGSSLQGFMRRVFQG
ncbi:hypothetical protein F0562_029801 [Nyssa sinensis]|uniref:Ubiquinone biosynthesis protein n=1 Tax=Nyssa sinensis TaxID=561372 RepID=A0A5J5AZ34_9ASTE|nr:hypothetical protein F0562_029801 [Nyssa sinensis]